MSRKGIHKAAAVFSTLQREGIELIAEGSKAAASEEGKQDIELGQMMKLGTDAMKDRFMQIIARKVKCRGASK